jgi:GT2 family glycosyltransferase
MPISLGEILKSKNNDYTRLAYLFEKKTGLNIVRSGYSRDISLTKSCSVIIPFYKNYSLLKRSLISLWYQELPQKFKKDKVEIIIVNDGSPLNLKNFIQQTKNFYRSVIYLKLKKNYGKAGAVAINLGLLYAKNEIIIFLNGDIVVPKDFLGSHLLRHEFLNKCIIVGFRHNISLKDLDSRLDKQKQKIKILPSYKKDFRYEKFIPKEWIRGWRSAFKDIPLENFNKTCHILKESNYFKNFGKGRIIGVWNLPFMFLACNVSVARKYVIEVGGFDLRFKGWGCEDTHLGAKLIGRGLYLIPNLHATVYHLIKGNHNKEKKKKIKEFYKNLKLYKKLLNESLVIFEENEWKEKTRKYFSNKFYEILR